MTEEEAEKLTFTRTMEVGLPLADINDKEFLGMAGSGGYNIFYLTDRDWETLVFQLLLQSQQFCQDIEFEQI